MRMRAKFLDVALVALCAFVVARPAAAFKDDIFVANSGGGMAILSRSNLGVMAYDSYGSITCVLPLTNGNVLTARREGSVLDILSGIDLSGIARDDLGSDPSVQRYCNKAVELSNGNMVIAAKSDIPGNQFAIVDIKRATDLMTLARQDIGYPVIQMGIQPDGDLVVCRQDYGPQWCFIDDGTNFDTTKTPPEIIIKSMWDPGYPITALGIQSDGDLAVGRDVANALNLLLMSGSDLSPIAYDDWGLATAHIVTLPDDSIVAARSDGIVDVRNGVDLGFVTRHAYGTPVNKMVLLPGGNVAIALSNGTIEIRTGSDLGLAATANGFGSITHLAVQSDGDLAVGSAEGGVWILDGSTLAVKAQISTGVAITQLAVMKGASAPADGITVAAAKALPDGTSMTCTGLVTGIYLGHFYIESPDRSCGIRVNFAPISFYAQSKVNVTGTLGTLATGERYISATNVVVTDTESASALGLTNRSVGGGAWNHDPGTGAGQQGTPGGVGLNNVGLRVRIWGEVTTRDAFDEFIYVDDGSKLSDGTGNIGIRVQLTGQVSTITNVPDAGTDVVISGVVSLEDVGGTIVRIVRPLDNSDVSAPSGL